jgi:hypothetical protein
LYIRVKEGYVNRAFSMSSCHFVPGRSLGWLRKYGGIQDWVFCIFSVHDVDMF